MRCASCGAEKFSEADDGTLTCDFCGVYSQEFVAEVEERVVGHDVTRRLWRGALVDKVADGKPTWQSVALAFGHILKMQSETMVNDFHCHPLLPQVARQLFVLLLKGELASLISAEQKPSNNNNNAAESKSTAETSFRTASQLLKPWVSLVLLFVSLTWLNEPITAVDIARLARAGTLPFLSAYRQTPSHLGHNSENSLLRPRNTVSGEFILLQAKKFAKSYNLALPPPPLPLLLARFVVELDLPEFVVGAALRLSLLLPSLLKKMSIVTYVEASPPHATIAALLLAVLIVSYEFGKTQPPSSPTWLQIVKNIKKNARNDPWRLTLTESYSLPAADFLGLASLVKTSLPQDQLTSQIENLLGPLLTAPPPSSPTPPLSFPPPLSFGERSKLSNLALSAEEAVMGSGTEERREKQFLTQIERKRRQGEEEGDEEGEEEDSVLHRLDRLLSESRNGIIGDYEILLRYMGNHFGVSGMTLHHILKSFGQNLAGSGWIEKKKRRVAARRRREGARGKRNNGENNNNNEAGEDAGEEEEKETNHGVAVEENEDDSDRNSNSREKDDGEEEEEEEEDEQQKSKRSRIEEQDDNENDDDIFIPSETKRQLGSMVSKQLAAR